MVFDAKKDSLHHFVGQVAQMQAAFVSGLLYANDWSACAGFLQKKENQ
jgi:hypothetical protein